MEGEDDEAQFMPLVNPSLRPPRRRASICAEKLDPSGVDKEVIQIPKTDEEIAKIRSILVTCVLFEHLDEAQLKKVNDAMFSVTKDEGEIIIKEGDDGDNFYLIDSGNVDVFIDNGDVGPAKLVNSYCDGESFGELAIMYNAPRAATCTARDGPVKLWALDRVTFKIILMKTAILKRNENKSFLREVHILSELTEHEILTIADFLHEEHFSDGTVICEEGMSGDSFYIVKTGKAICTKLSPDGASTKVGVLQHGSYFGEIALLTTKKRQATVTACGPMDCLSLGRNTFNRVMGPLREILMRNMETYIRIQEYTS